MRYIILFTCAQLRKCCMYFRYVECNVKALETVRTYNTNIPSFLRNRLVIVQLPVHNVESIPPESNGTLCFLYPSGRTGCRRLPADLYVTR